MSNSEKIIGTIGVIIRTSDRFPDVEDKQKGVIGLENDKRWFMIPDVDKVPYEVGDEVVMKYVSWEYQGKLYFKLINMFKTDELTPEELEGIDRITKT